MSNWIRVRMGPWYKCTKGSVWVHPESKRLVDATISPDETYMTIKVWGLDARGEEVLKEFSPKDYEGLKSDSPEVVCESLWGAFAGRTCVFGFLIIKQGSPAEREQEKLLKQTMTKNVTVVADIHQKTDEMLRSLIS